VLDFGPWIETIQLTPNQRGVALVILDHEHANLFHPTVFASLGIVSVGR